MLQTLLRAQLHINDDHTTYFFYKDNHEYPDHVLLHKEMVLLGELFLKENCQLFDPVVYRFITCSTYRLYP